MPGERELTQRELQVLGLVAAGESTAAIARRLGVAENTVKSHLTSIYRKTGAANRVQATRHYLERYSGQSPARAQELPDWSVIEQQMAAIRARLDDLAPAATEAERLRQALQALSALADRASGSAPRR